MLYFCLVDPSPCEGVAKETQAQSSLVLDGRRETQGRVRYPCVARPLRGGSSPSSLGVASRVFRTTPARGARLRVRAVCGAWLH